MKDPSRWEVRYQSGDLPWDTGQPNTQLVELVESGCIAGGRALEIGIGTGTNAVWLAGQGFEVTGVDISPTAVQRARARGRTEGVSCVFEVADFLVDDVAGGPFDFAFDSGCFHTFDEAPQRARFAERVASLLVPGGHWFSLIGSTDGPPRDHGPPRHSALEVVEAVEPSFEVLSMASFLFEADIPSPARGWRCLFRRRRP